MEMQHSTYEACRVALHWDGSLAHMPGVAVSLVTGDIGIFAVYQVIAVTLFVYILRSKMPFPDLALLFSAFMQLCGLTHLVKVFVMWRGLFVLEAVTEWACLYISALAATLLAVRYRGMVKWSLMVDAMRLTLATTTAELRQQQARLEEKFREMTELDRDASS